MAYVLLIGLLSFLTPLIVARLFLSFIIPKRFFSLPWRFSTVQLILALVATPIIVFASYIFALILAFRLKHIAGNIAPSLLSSFYFDLLYSYVATLFSYVFRNFYIAFYLLRDRYTLLSPFNIQDNVKESLLSILSSFTQFLKEAEFLQIFQHVQLPPEWVNAPTFDFHLFDELRRNLTITSETLHYIDPVNIAVNRFLGIVQVDNVLNVTRLPPEFNAALLNVTDEMHQLANNLNFTLLLKGDIVPDNPLFRIGKSLQTTVESIDLKSLYEATVLLPASELNIDSSEKLALLSLLEDPFQFIFSDRNPANALSFRAAASVYIELAQRYVLSAIPIMCVLLPLMFGLAMALHGCLWWVTRRYRSMIPVTQRSTSGWMCVAAISGLAVVIAEAFILCSVFYYKLFYATDLNPWFMFCLIFSALKGAPVRTASHMRLAEGVAEKDILNERKFRLWKGIFVCALSNGLFSVWWLFSSGVLLFSLQTYLLSLAVGLVDIVIIGFSIAWGRRVFRRLIEKEQRLKAAQGRKLY